MKWHGVAWHQTRHTPDTFSNFNIHINNIIAGELFHLLPESVGHFIDRWAGCPTQRGANYQKKLPCPSNSVAPFLTKTEAGSHVRTYYVVWGVWVWLWVWGTGGLDFISVFKARAKPQKRIDGQMRVIDCIMFMTDDDDDGLLNG